MGLPWSTQDAEDFEMQAQVLAEWAAEDAEAAARLETQAAQIANDEKLAKSLAADETMPQQKTPEKPQRLQRNCRDCRKEQKQG